MTILKVSSCRNIEEPRPLWLVTGICTLTFFFVFFPVPIQIDLDQPWLNPTGGMLTVLHARDLPGAPDTKYEGNHYDGVTITLKVDPRFYWRSKEDKTKTHYQMSVFSDSELLLKIPSQDFDLYNNRDLLEMMVRFGQAPPELLHGLNHADASYADRAGDDEFATNIRKYIYLRLVFQEPVKLKAEYIHPQFDPERPIVKAERQMTMKADPLKKGRDAVYSSYLVWKIARSDTTPYKKKRTQKKEEMNHEASLFDSPDRGNGTMDDANEF